MELEELRAFVAVVDEGSLSAAAQATDIPRSTLRRRLESLEAGLKCPLFSPGRTPQLTQRGQALEALARRLLMHADQVEATIRGTTAQPERTVVVIVQTGMSPALAFHIADMLRSRTPQLNFELRIRDEALAALTHEGDLAVTLDTEIPEDGVWITRRLMAIPLRLRASEEYLERKGTPKTLSDLADHNLVTCSMIGPGATLPLRSGGTIAVVPTVITDDISFCRHAALSGYGISLAPPPVPTRTPRNGPRLHTLFEDEVGIDIHCRLFAPGGLSSRPRIASIVQEMVDFADQLKL